jgi:mRNA interferase YafQ
LEAVKPVRTATQFKKDIKLLQKRGKDLGKLEAVILTLAADEKLAPKHKDHALTGNWKGWRDCHIEPDWLLIFQSNADKLVLARTGTHADIF